MIELETVQEDFRPHVEAREAEGSVGGVAGGDFVVLDVAEAGDESMEGFESDVVGVVEGEESALLGDVEVGFVLDEVVVCAHVAEGGFH